MFVVNKEIAKAFSFSSFKDDVFFPTLSRKCHLELSVKISSKCKEICHHENFWTQRITKNFISAIVPVAAATMTPLPLLAALIVMKVRDCLVQKEKLPNITGESDQDVSIIKTKKMDHEMKMEESESKVKLVANGDANENCLA